MKTKMLSAAALLALAGQAVAQPVIDGTRDAAFYGSTPLWIQNQATTRGDNAVLSCDPCLGQNTQAAAVQTGIEIAIPLSAIGNPSASAIKIVAFVGSNDASNVSNQIAATANGSTTVALPCPADSLGEVRNIDLSTIANNQFVVPAATPFPNATLSGGRAGKETFYFSRQFTQNNRTSYGNATTGLAGQCSGGSEIDGVYSVVTSDTLYILVTGNLETNGNRLQLFIDSNASVGQNQLIAGNPTNSFGALQRMGPNADPAAGAVGPGLKFDSAFTADYWISINNQFDSGTSTYNAYVDYARLANVSAPADPGVGLYCGTTTTPAGTGELTGGEVGAPAIKVSVNNSNILGVEGFCPPSGGNPDVANGSELDNAYGRIFNNKLYLFFGGNLANNFDKLQLFFDAQSGGQPRIGASAGGSPVTNVDIDFGALQRMGDDGTGNGLSFDTGFVPDYWLNIGNGNGASAATIQVFSNAATLRSNGAVVTGLGFPLDYGAYFGGTKATLPVPGIINFQGPLLDPQTGTAANVYSGFAPRTASRSLQANPTAPVGTPNLIRAAINNSNLAGVTSATAASPSVAGAAAVDTGIEMEIDLSELTDCGQPANPTCASITSLKVAGFISFGPSNNRLDTISNQVIGGLPLPGTGFAADFPEVRNINFSTIAGNQFITVTNAGPTSSCYANCDNSTVAPVLNAGDFSCFLSQFRSAGSLPAGQQVTAYANCDNSTVAPVLNAGDFSCFLSRFRAGCP